MKLETLRFDLQLKNTFRISHTARDEQPTLIVAITSDGYTGYGEAAATSYYGVSVEGMAELIQSLKPLIAEHISKSPEEVWGILHPHFKGNSFAQCALDIALHDLHGKRLQKPLYELWGLNLRSIPLSNYTIGIDSVEMMVQKIIDFPWPLYKIKLGTSDDLGLIKELRKHTDATFRVDANGAWTAEQTIEYSRELEKLGVEFIEQPLPADDLEGMKKVYSESVLPVIADESCISEADVEKCAGLFHGVNVKLTKCGGLTPARRMLKQARELGLQTMVGCMTESTVGLSAIGHLLPLLDYVDMDGGMLIKNDIADGVKVYDGKTHFPDRNGTGALLLRDNKELKLESNE